MDDILVSIWCVAYNHELYIRDAIEGFLSQKTNFKYEIIIHDDASTDRTAEIIREYEEKHPNLMQCIYQTENQFTKNQPSIEWLWKIQFDNCKGKYIAICEGDDYWIDTRKLQIQVDYLEMHPECMMTTHNVIDLNYRNHTVTPVNLYLEDGVVPNERIISQKAALLTGSMVYRTEVLKLDKFFLNAGIGDYPYLLYSLSKGDIYYFSRIMSVYRRNHKGSWSDTMLDLKKNMIYRIQMIDFLQKYNRYTNCKYEKVCISKIQEQVDVIVYLNSEKSKESFLELCQKCDVELSKKYHDIFEKVFQIWMLIFDEKYLNSSIKKFCKKNNKIVIMGAGKYASILAKKLKYYGINLEGFVVSNNQEITRRYMEKPVWKMKELLIHKKEIGIIIGINPIKWEEIIYTFEEADIKNYMCPFLLE